LEFCFVAHSRGGILRPPGGSQTIIFRYKEIRDILHEGNIEEMVLYLSKEYLDKNVTFLRCFVRNISPISS
jgi:hypothetical protein